VFVRSGWGQLWDDGDAYVGHATGVPGVGEAGARWLAGTNARAVGADTIAFERLAPGHGHTLLPAHRVLLVDAGINIIETMALEEIAADGIHEFLAVIVPLNLVGATGSPVRPLAIVTP
jgi:kynurenine formamidase